MKSPGLRNSIATIVGETVWGFQMQMIAVSTVLVILLRNYGAGAGMIGAIPALEGALILPQMAGNYLFRSRRTRKYRMLLYHFVAIVPWLFLMGLLAYPGLGVSDLLRRWSLLLCFACYYLAIGVVGAAWSDWFADLFNRSIRGRVLGVSIAGAYLSGTAGALMAGWLIDRYNGPEIYAWLYLLAGAIASVALIMYMFIRDPGAQAADPPRLTTAAIVSQVKHSLKNSNFRRFLIGRILTTIGFCVLPFVAVYYLSPQGGGLNAGVVVACSAAQNLSMAISLALLGHLGDKRGHRIGLVIGAVSQAAALAVVLLSAGLISCIVVYTLVGLAAAAGVVSHMNMLFETCPHNNRMAHISAGNFVVSLPAMAAPLLAGQLARGYGLPILFAASLGLSVLAAAWTTFRVKDPRDIAVMGS